MKIRCLVVEDEPPAQEVMRRYIESCPQLELAGIAPDAFAAIDLLHSQEIGLIFLDINLPRLSGLNFLKTLSSPPPVIFTTAYPEYAVEGFEADAVDYLVKPFSFERFLKAVNKAASRIHTPETETDEPCFIFRADRKTYRIRSKDIHYVEATGDYLKIFLDGKHMVIHETMKGFLDKAQPGKFLRVHKSFVVAVERIHYLEGNRISLGSVFIPVGRLYKEEVERILKS
jgi:DNA-binding LytR/AlgR family response regulator